jgi:hypothetical protein
VTTGPWRITLSPAQLAKLRDEPAFHRLLTLGRILNSLRFAECAIFDRAGDDSTAGARQRSGAFLYICALLDEAYIFIDRLGQHFRHLPAFKRDLVPLFRDPVYEELRLGLLSRLRNKAVYHHDDDVVPAGLQSLRREDYILAAGDSPRVEDVFYPLSDDVVIAFGAGLIDPGKSLHDAFNELLSKLTDLEKRFALALERLAAEALAELGCEVSEPSE